MKKPNKILAAGMLVIALTFLLKHFKVNLPDFVEGVMIGVGIGLELLGIYAEKHDISKLKNLKVKLYNLLSGKNA